MRKTTIKMVIVLLLAISCQEVTNNNTIKDSEKEIQLNVLNNSNNYLDSLIADSILTQVIGYVTKNVDTVQVVNFVDIHRTDGKKLVIINCLTSSTPTGYAIGIQFYDSTGIGLGDDKTKKASCVKISGCVCGDCVWSAGEYPTSTCKCDKGSSCSGDCGIEVEKFSLLGYETVGQIIRNNAVIANMNIYDY